MKPLSPFVLLALACLATSCNPRQTHGSAAGPAAAATPAEGYCLPASTAWAEEEYTQWMTRAELQFFHDQTPPNQYFAHVEGRNNAGLGEYRAVRKPLPTEQYVEAAVFWGLGEKDAFENELRLLRAGFVRKSMQVFVDASGKALHQIVWLKPVGATPAAAPQETASSPPPPEPEPEPEPEPATPTAAAEPPAPTPAAEPETTSPRDASAGKPPAAIVVAPPEPRAASEPEPASPKKFTTYTVVQGDILEKIARRYHTTTEAIMAANNLKNDSLHIGQKLKIPKK